MKAKTNPIPRSLKLAVRPDKAQAQYIPVHWCVDEQSWQGIIYVSVPISYGDDRPIIAEICAANHLMDATRPIFGNTRAPASAKVTMTCGAIKKLFRQETQKTTLIPFGRALIFSFAESGIHITKDIQWTETLPVNVEFRIEARHTDWEQAFAECLKQKVGISRHAVERFQERIGAKSFYKAVTSIQRMLASGETSPIRVSERKRQAAMEKHGKEAILLKHHATKTVFVITREEENALSLVSVYCDDVLKKEPVMVYGRIEMRWPT